MVCDTVTEELERLPGLFRVWDFSRVIMPGATYRIEDSGMTHDGAALFAIYQVIVPGSVH